MYNLFNKKRIRTLGILLLLSLGMIGTARAASGGINATDKWAWGTNIGWVNFNPTHGDATIYNDHLEGYIWAENVGWIRLGTYTGGDAHTYANDAFDTYGVNNDGYGNLSGYAWGTNIGWINFNPSHSQVTVDPLTGAFDGYAWSENVGWIHFKNSGTYAYNVVTSLVRSVGPGFVVNTDADTDDGSCDALGTGSGNQDCTLREAINAANADPYYTNTISFAANYTITLTSALPDIATDLTIDGNGAANTIVQASTCDPVNLPEGCTPSDWRVFTFTMGSSTLKDMTIRYGNCGGSGTCNDGGGIYNNGTLTLVNSSLSNNASAGNGGAIFNLNSSMTVTNVTFNANSATTGGGMCNISSSPTLTNVTFSNNQVSNDGGGMININSNPSLTDVIFNANTASNGGGMFNTSNSSPSLTNVTFSNNQVTNDGGGMFNSGGSPTVKDLTFNDNSAYDGGGMFNSSSSPSLTNVTFSRNQATNNGGGILNSGGSPTLTNLTFSDNQATDSGGGMYNTSSSPTLANVTFSGNQATNNGGGIHNGGGSPILTNVILWGNTATSSGNEIYNANSSTPTISYSVVQGSGGSTSWDSSFGTDGGNNLDADPQLVPLADNGGSTQTFALQENSPAINAGDNDTCTDTDQRGMSRPFPSTAGQCDIGAYELSVDPENDFLVFAYDIPTPVYTSSINTETATQSISDPNLQNECGITDAGQATVWYTYTPADNTAISIDTFGSDYNTFIAVWTDGAGGLELVACNDDSAGSIVGESQLAIQVQKDTPYYIEVGQP